MSKTDHARPPRNPSKRLVKMDQYGDVTRERNKQERRKARQAREDMRQQMMLAVTVHEDAPAIEEHEHHYGCCEPLAEWECVLLNVPLNTLWCSESDRARLDEEARIEDLAERDNDAYLDLMESYEPDHDDTCRHDDEPEYVEDTEADDGPIEVTWREMLDMFHLNSGDLPVMVGSSSTPTPRLHPAGPGRVAVYELAREVGMDSSAVIHYLRLRVQEFVANAHSMVPKPVADRVRRDLGLFMVEQSLRQEVAQFFA